MPFAVTFAAFWARAYDFIRMAAISRANLKLVGSHAGVSIGQDGPSQMGLEDIAMFRAVHDSVVLYPCDANQDVVLTPGSRRTKASGICGPPVATHRLSMGRVRISRRRQQDAPCHDADQVTIVAAGITVHEACGPPTPCGRRPARPGDRPLLGQAGGHGGAARRRGDTGWFVTVEDHWAEGGLGDAVLAAFGNGHQAPRTHQAGGARHAGVRPPGRAVARGGDRREGNRGAALALITDSQA